MPENTDDEGGAKFSDMARRLESALKKRSNDTMANGLLNEITDTNFMGTIKKARTAIVEFYSIHCPYCKQLVPILEKLAADYKSEVYFAKVDVDVISEARIAFDVQGVPLVVALKKGMAVAKLEGLRSIDDYDDWIDSIQKGLRPLTFKPGPISKIE
jgi:thioredoxin-like negative regulator of GroEL